MENYLNKFGCSIVIIDENTKMQERHGTGEGKEYRFYLNSMNFYQVREEDLMVRKDNKDKIKSATVSKLLLSFDNMMQKHSRNTY